MAGVPERSAVQADAATFLTYFDSDEVPAADSTEYAELRDFFVDMVIEYRTYLESVRSNGSNSDQPDDTLLIFH